MYLMHDKETLSFSDNNYIQVYIIQLYHKNKETMDQLNQFWLTTISEFYGNDYTAIKTSNHKKLQPVEQNMKPVLNNKK